MRVSICGITINQWQHLGIIQALHGIESLTDVRFCACGACEDAQSLSVQPIPIADVTIFCQAIDGLFVAADGMNFKNQSHLLDCCMANTALVSTFHTWATQVANSSTSAVTLLSSFLLSGQLLTITPGLAFTVINTCDEFSLADRIRFCVAHEFLPIVKKGILNAWLQAAWGMSLTEREYHSLSNNAGINCGSTSATGD